MSGMKEHKRAARPKRGGDHKRPLTERIFWICLLAVMIVFVLCAFFGKNSFQNAWMLRRQREGIERENRSIAQRNDMLRRKISLARKDPDFLEHIVREKLGMIGENERLYLFGPQE
jgi:cell division protein FtsB